MDYLIAFFFFFFGAGFALLQTFTALYWILKVNQRLASLRFADIIQEAEKELFNRENENIILLGL